VHGHSFSDRRKPRGRS